MTVQKTPEAFYIEFNGQIVDYDGAYSTQCVDGFKVFCHWADVPVRSTINGWADGYWIYRFRMQLDKYFDFITGSENFRNGDWVIWKQKSISHPHSHIAMYYNGKEFGENQGGDRGFCLKKTNFSDAEGALRWKGFIKEEPEDPLDQYTDEQLADRVLQGYYGNGTERKRLLGDRYPAVQKIVNDRLNKRKVYYIVKKGDTLTKIAKRFGTSVPNIVKLNKIEDPNLIFPGQKLRIK